MQINSYKSVSSHLLAAGADLPDRRIASEPKVGIKHIFYVRWYVQHFTPNVSEQNIVIGQLISTSATKLAYIKRTASNKDVSTKNIRTFELEVKKELMFYFI